MIYAVLAPGNYRVRVITFTRRTDDELPADSRATTDSYFKTQIAARRIDLIGEKSSFLLRDFVFLSVFGSSSVPRLKYRFAIKN